LKRGSGFLHGAPKRIFERPRRTLDRIMQLQIVESAIPRNGKLTITEAARIAGRSESWIRRGHRFGWLVPAMVDGKQAVTAESLSALVRDGRGGPRRDRPRRPKKRPPLRLIVDNT
jgi:hypothetical protein